ncbi:hypothetical protein BFW38_13450 [Terasakiispira papahanaumokuakeensis]|uniref:N-acetyltransferase domain-containing protein n=1 Tax=Terasakiispira papahanaumokuakeensis TaxID=197479 RepID=A0A1E2VC41_9GAMM|nr:GNAT family N-acetyltransferase [Terasakiispira papahanaumokuakeensis]ODC04386.1 hypothetical protein BFW38_13450 [Terasakiispira papahanaumokuakeensis]
MKPTDQVSFQNSLYIRPVKWYSSDADFLERLHRESREDLTLIEGDDDFIYSLVDMQYQARNQGYGTQFPNAVDLMIESAGTPIGRMTVDQGANEVRLVDLALIKTARGQGYGQQIVQSLMQASAMAGLPLTLTVQRLNASALHTYAKLGFQVLDENPLQLHLIWTPPGRASVFVGV